MMRQKHRVSSEQKITTLKKRLAARPFITFSDVRKILKQQDQTLSKTLSRLVKSGQIRRVGKGLYTFTPKIGGSPPVLLSELGKNVRDILLQTGYRFFISGLDVLGPFLEHIPESFPVLLFTDPSSVEEVRDLLAQKEILALAYPETKNYRAFRDAVRGKEIVLIYPTSEFTYADNGLPSIEKAFIDLYYVTTREDYPFPIQELARLYQNMQRQMSIDLRRLTKVASRRSLKNEFAKLVDLSLQSKGFSDLLEFFTSHTRAPR